MDFLLCILRVSVAYPMDPPAAKDKDKVNQELFSAVTTGNSDEVNRLLQKTANVNAHNESGNNMLFVALAGGYIAPVGPVLAYPGTARIEGLDQCLSIAIEMKHKEVARVLLQHGAFLDKDDPRNNMLGDLFDGNELLRAVVVSDIDNVGRELTCGVDVSIIQEALLLAIGQGRVAVIVRLVRYFIDHGMRDYLAKEAKERLMMLYARCQSDVLTQRYRNIEKVLIAVSPSMLDMGYMSSAALPKLIAPQLKRSISNDIACNSEFYNYDGSALGVYELEKILKSGRSCSPDQVSSFLDNGVAVNAQLFSRNMSAMRV